MASQDDIYDVVDSLDKIQIEYLLVAIQKGKKNGKADIFYSLADEDSLKILSEGLKTFAAEVEKRKDNGEVD